MVLDNSENDKGAIELDKIEIPTLPPQKKQPKEPQESTETKVSSAPKPEAPVKPPSDLKGQHWKLSIIVGGVALAAVLMFVFYGNTLNLPFISKKISGPPANYLKVGPVTATISNNDIVKMTVEINCKNKKVKNKLKKMDLVIRDRMLNVLNKPDTQKLLKSNDYNAIRSRIKENLIALMPDQAIQDVYFSEFLTY